MLTPAAQLALVLPARPLEARIAAREPADQSAVVCRAAKWSFRRNRHERRYESRVFDDGHAPLKGVVPNVHPPGWRAACEVTSAGEGVRSRVSR